MNPFGSDEDDDEEADEEYVCQSCGEEWEEEATAFYINGRCTHCKAPGSNNKIIKDRDNPMTRDDTQTDE